MINKASNNKREERIDEEGNKNGNKKCFYLLVTGAVSLLFTISPDKSGIININNDNTEINATCILSGC